MGFFGKKEEKRLPDLPSPRDAGFSRALDEESHPLPTFPDSPIGNRFSESAIRSAISSEERIAPPSETEEKRVRVVEMKEWEPHEELSDDMGEHEESHDRFMPPEEKPKTADFMRPMEFRKPQMQQMRKERVIPPREVNREVPMKSHNGVMNASKEIFVKIDKYYTARKAMADISSKLEEIEEMVRKIRETKLREEQEIASWERDIMQAKTRIQEVNENLFDKTE